MRQHLVRYLFVLNGFSLASCTSPAAQTTEAERVQQVASSPVAPGLSPTKTEAARAVPDDTLNAASQTPSLSSRPVFVPDSSINGILLLEHPLPVHGPLGTLPVALTEGLRESPVAVFVNQDRRQYLLASHYEGDTQNAFACVEVGYVSPAMLQRPHRQIAQVRFRTQSGLYLGQRLQQALALKGHAYRLRLTPDSVLTYRLDSPKESAFLQRYAMPGYFLELTIRRAKIKTIRFGFDYP